MTNMTNQFIISSTDRTVSRAWKADPVLLKVFDTIIMNKDSFSRLIHNSVQFKTWFQDHIRSQSGCPVDNTRARDLSFAKHRFNSTQKPLGRKCIFLDNMIATVVPISSSRARSSVDS